MRVCSHIYHDRAWWENHATQPEFMCELCEDKPPMITYEIGATA